MFDSEQLPYVFCLTENAFNKGINCVVHHHVKMKNIGSGVPPSQYRVVETQNVCPLWASFAIKALPGQYFRTLQFPILAFPHI